MQQDTAVTAIAHVIQLSVAPVFLLSGIGAMLAVMTNRLARIVDRARVIEKDVIQSGIDASKMIQDELHALARRARMISRSITLCTATALFICAVIAVLFLGAFLRLDTELTATVVALLFVAAMMAFFWGLLMFLREIFVAAASLRIGLQQVPASKSVPGSGAPDSSKKTGA